MMEAVDMQIGTETTTDGGVKVTVTYGPTLVAVIFDVDDEEKIIDVMRRGFSEARDYRDGIAAGDNGHVHDG